MGLGFPDQVLDGRIIVHYFKHRSLSTVGGGNQLLADNGLQHHGKLNAHLALLAGGEHVDDTVNSVGRTGSMQSREKQLTGLGSGHGHLDGFQVAHLPQKDHVRAFP